MNKSDFLGFKQVFLFEFMTGIKKPAFKIFIAIVCALAFFAMPVILLIGKIKGDDDTALDATAKSAIESVYVYDSTGLTIDYSRLNNQDKYSDVVFIRDDMSYTDAVSNLDKDSDKNNLVLKTEYDSKNRFDVTVVYSKKSGITDNDLSVFQDDFKDFYRNEILRSVGASTDDFDNLSKDINITVMKPSKDGSFKEDTASITTSDYSIMMAGMFILFMFVNMSVSTVATSVATEKSSRVIEYLLTGTRPLALLSGKIAARLLETVITAFAAYSCNFLSQIVCMLFMTGNVASNDTTSNVIVVSSIWESITLSKLLIAVLYFLAGLALFSVIGALTGASVSKLDELQDANKLYSFIIIVCVYADMFLIIMMLNSGGTEVWQNFCTLFPLTGAFITPALLLTGRISILTGCIALIIIVITAAVTFILAGAVYESMLLFQGKRLGIKDITALMKKQVIT